MILLNLTLIRNKFTTRRRKFGLNSFHILHESKAFRAILSTDFHQKKYVVKVNNSYTVEIANDLDLLIKLGFEVRQNRLMPLKRLCRINSGN
jgi:hypothetical protein